MGVSIASLGLISKRSSIQTVGPVSPLLELGLCICMPALSMVLVGFIHGSQLSGWFLVDGEIKIAMSRYSCVCKRLHFESLRSGVGTSICLLILSLSHDRGCPARYTGSHYTSKLSFAQSHIFPKSGYMFLKGRLYVPKQISFKKSPK